MLQTSATVFSWELKINGAPIDEPFAKTKFTYTVNGMGTSGVCTGQFEFDLYDSLGQYSEALLEEAEAQLSCGKLYFDSKTYLISSRSTSKKICHFTCYDRMCKTDKKFDLTDFPFNENNTADAEFVLSRIVWICGFADYAASGTGLEYIKIKKSDLENITCRRALEIISEAMCGVWVCDKDNVLYLACLGGGAYGDYAPVTEYAEIDYQGKNKITALTMTNSDSGESYSFGDAEYGTPVEIDTPYTSAELAQIVWNRIGNLIYTAWNCGKAVVTHGTLGSLTGLTMQFEDGSSLFAANTEFAMDSTGIYFSGGASPQDEWTYDEYLERRKLTIGKNIGNTRINENGDIVLRNLNKGGGLINDDNGICVYRSEN